MFWTYFSIVVAVVFGILSVYLYFAGRKEKAPVFSYKSVNLIGKNPELPDDIEILHRGTSVPSVCRTKILFWNIGRDTIDKKDVVGKICIKFPRDAKILREPVIETLSRNQIGFQASNSDDVIYLDFAFLDKDDGALIEVLHTGDSESEIAVEGTIKGVPHGIKLVKALRAIERRREISFLKLSLLAISVAFLLILAIRIFLKSLSADSILSFVGVATATLLYYLLSSLYRGFVMKRAPSWADAF